MSYMIAKLNNVYMPDYSGLRAVRFISDDRGNTEHYDTLIEAQIAVDALNNDTYITINGESGRPDYYIVNDDVGDYIESGRNGDGGNYDWDCCDCSDGDDGECCGQCGKCLDNIIDEDRTYIIKFAVKS